MAKKHLIIGSGIAALSAVRAIRRITQDDEVKAITTENCLPYSPAVLPYLISKKTNEENISIADKEFFRETGCTFENAREVTQIKPERKEVIYKDGGFEQYDRLLIATGSYPLRPTIKGIQQKDALCCHTLADCRDIMKRLGKKSKVILYGAGLVALELAAALLETGHSVAIVVRSRILRRYFDEESAGIISRIFKEHGADIRQGAEITGARREGTTIVVSLSDGTTLEGDVLVCCLGVNPNVDFLGGSGVEVNDGVVVDQYMRTNIEDIYAAGDVAESTDFFNGERGVNAIAPSAISQGRVAGSNMAGLRMEHPGWIAMNVFKFLKHTAFSVGIFEGEGLHSIKEKGEKYFKELAFKDDRLVGVRFIDIDIDPGVFRYLIETSTEVKQKALLLERPQETSLSLMMLAEKGVQPR